MGTDNLQHKRANARRRRNQKTMQQRASTWLIVSEGTETEVNYFNSLNRFLNRNGKKKINVEVKGTGTSTINVVNKVEEFFRVVDKEKRKSKNSI